KRKRVPIAPVDDAPPPAPAEPVEAAPGEAAAPIQKRGGRVQLDNVAGASLVFKPKTGADAPELPPGEVAAPVQKKDGRIQLENVAGASVVFAPKKPPTEQKTESESAPLIDDSSDNDFGEAPAHLAEKLGIKPGAGTVTVDTKDKKDARREPKVKVLPLVI